MKSLFTKMLGNTHFVNSRQMWTILTDALEIMLCWEWVNDFCPNGSEAIDGLLETVPLSKSVLRITNGFEFR